jgi:site-specific DNA recombinase
MDQKKLVHIQTFTQKFANDPSQKFLLMILCSQAKLENDNKGINVKRGLRAKVEMGLWPCRPPTGYLPSRRTDRKGCAEVDPERGKIIRQCFEKIGYENWTGMKTFKWLTDEVKFITESGMPLSLGNFYKLMYNTFYYGIFEFPGKSGQFYKGAHEPIISKELFDLVQKNIVDNKLSPKYAQKEFTFTRLFTCGLCGSGITADEKFKKLKGGGTNRHIYYKCTKVRDIKCKNGYLNETDLVLQLSKVIDKLDFNKVAIKEKVVDEVNRFKKFQNRLLKSQTQILFKEIDLKDYVKFILEDGDPTEKREILSCFKNRLTISGREIVLKD